MKHKITYAISSELEETLNKITANDGDVISVLDNGTVERHVFTGMPKETCREFMIVYRQFEEGDF